MARQYSSCCPLASRHRYSRLHYPLTLSCAVVGAAHVKERVVPLSGGWRACRQNYYVRKCHRTPKIMARATWQLCV
eukprot:scaffold111612_cov68-Phaeocystis_antarctica.AAC.2